MFARLRILTVVGVCVCVLACARSAAAKTSLQFNGALSLGWTDNVRNAALYNAIAIERPIADFFGDIRPSLVLTTGTARALQAISYTFNYTYFFRTSQSNSYSNRLDWQGAYLPTNRTTLLVGFYAMQAEQSTAAFTQDAALPTLLRTNRYNYASIGLRETLTYEASPRWRVSETIGVTGTVPIAPRTNAATMGADGLLQANYLWRKIAVGGSAQTQYFYGFETRGTVTNADGTKTPNVRLSPSQGTITTAVMARYRQDVGNFWNLEAALGFLNTVQQNGEGSSFGPSALAAVRYARPEGAFALTYSHTTQPNALLAALYLSDSALVNLTAPLGIGTHLNVAITGGYSYLRQVLPSGGTGSPAHSVSADVALYYLPTPGVSLYLRGQTQFQHAEDERNATTPSLRRDAIFIGISGYYPTTAAAIVPRAAGSRVDGSDAPMNETPHRPTR